MENRKRKAENTTPTIPEWVKEALECPVCLEMVQETPVFMCGNDITHSFCKKCYDLLFSQGLKCPVCREALTRNRNLALEKMVQSLPKLPCKNEGCSFQNTDPQVVKKHQEEECEHRNISCFQCDEVISLSKLAEHLASTHEGRSDPLVLSGEVKICRDKFMNKNGYFATSLKTLNSYEITRDGKTTLFVMNTVNDEKFLYFWVAFCGPKYQAEKFKYTMKVASAKDVNVGRLRFLFEGTRPCVPCDISLHEVIEEGACIIINEKLIQQASDKENGDFYYVFKVDEVTP